MADIIDFNKAKEERVVPTGNEVLSMQVYLTEDGQHELFMEIGDYDNERIFDALSSQQPKHTCLLYTSPSPRDRTRSRMPSSA